MEELNSELYKWIDEHAKDDPLKLRLKYVKQSGGFDYDAAIRQIECRRQFRKKLADTLARAPRFYFPTRLSGEQSTSDLLADYHKTLVKINESLIDLTSGLGIDVFHCAEVCSRVVAVEWSEKLARALRINAAQLGRDNIRVICGDCRDVISHPNTEMFGTAFIDPARRDANGGRVFSLADCEPDVTAMLPSISKICRRLIVKMSPMLDISHTINALDGCSQIISLGTATECKELIAVKDFDRKSSEIEIKGITLLPDGISDFSYTKEEEQGATMPNYSIPESGAYLYEPFPSVMKLSANKLLAVRYGLDAFHPNCRLYHSAEIAEAFPGEIFEIENVIEYSSKNIKRFKKDFPLICVTARNFGISSEVLRIKLGVKEGGERRVIGLTSYDNKRLLLIVKRN